MFFKKRSQDLDKLNDDFSKASHDHEVSSRATSQRLRGFNDENRKMSNEFWRANHKIQDKINKFT